MANRICSLCNRVGGISLAKLHEKGYLLKLTVLRTGWAHERCGRKVP